MDRILLKPSSLTLNPNRTLFSVFMVKIRKCKDFRRVGLREKEINREME